MSIEKKDLPTIEDMAEAMYSATVQYTDIHFEVNNKAPLDRQRWAALHIGFTGCMKFIGYSEKEVLRTVDICQELMEDRMHNIL